MFRIGIDHVVQKRGNPCAPAFIPRAFIGGQIGAVTVGVAHKSAVLMVDYMLVKKRDVIIEEIVAVLLTDFLQCFPADFTVVIQY